MITKTRFYRNGVGPQNIAFARKCVANQQTPCKRSLEQTVEYYSESDVVVRPGCYGVTYFVRSRFSCTRFYVVLQTAYGATCTCGKPACHHILAAYRAQQESAVA